MKKGGKNKSVAFIILFSIIVNILSLQLVQIKITKLILIECSVGGHKSLKVN